MRSPLLAEEYGQNKTITLLSSGNNMFVMFKSGKRLTGRGFVARYVTISAGNYITYLKSEQLFNIHNHNNHLKKTVLTDTLKSEFLILIHMCKLAIYDI